VFQKSSGKYAKAKCVVYFGLHENETSAKAHLVIPALSFLEKNDVKLSYGHHFVGRMPKIVENSAGISEYDLAQKLLQAFGHEALPSDESIIEEVIASNSVLQDGFFKFQKHMKRFLMQQNFIRLVVSLNF